MLFPRENHMGLSKWEAQFFFAVMERKRECKIHSVMVKVWEIK
jgi:hypothetical protein